MVNFANLKRLDITDKTARYEVSDMLETPKPVLIVRPTGSDNKLYFNEMLRLDGGTARTAQKEASQPLYMLDKEKRRNIDRQLFSQHVIVGWEGIRDNDGNLVPFSAGACAEFIAAIPDYVFDGIRNFCDTPSSFLTSPVMDGELVAGN